MTANHVVPFSSDRSEKPYTVVISITPEIAQRWLTKNTHNRAVREDVVKAYARDMIAGNWKLTGESIKWDASHNLLDGQHRLWASVRSGVTVQMFVTFNLPADAQSAMDSGAKRTASDALSLDGEKNAALLSSIIRMALSVNADGYDSAGRYQATHAEIADVVDDSFRDAAAFASNIAKKVCAPPTIVGYTYWRLSRISQADAHAFWLAAAEKVGLTAGDPVIALTDQLMEARRNRRVLSKPVMLSLIFRAWNARRAHRPMQRLRINSPVLSSSGLPVPVAVPDPK